MRSVGICGSKHEVIHKCQELYMAGHLVPLSWSRLKIQDPGPESVEKSILHCKVFRIKGCYHGFSYRYPG